jgi:toxin ParE1/3/4
MKLRWSEEAVEDLVRIGRYVGQYDGVAARKLLSRLRGSVVRLKEHPDSGRVVPELGRSDVREVIEGSYRLVYQVEESGVVVLVVFDSHRLFPFERLDIEE